ncbi:radical SAM protein [Candidatus Gracilibacteria bacterium]|nr:MAG: radical SAM protein [Candidatus Gracilibacteria bacterium]
MAFYNQTYDKFLESTQSFCHNCNNISRLIEAQVVVKDNEVFLRKFCTECGEVWSKTSTDYEYYKMCNDFLKQPDLPEQALTPVKHGCPWDCGVCEQHQNHPCLALFNVIDECNMRCNICYHMSEPGAGNPRSMQDIKKMHETLLKVESEPDIIQVTGGEPTLHPEILDILKYLKKGPVRHLMINTNGIRISHDENFVKELKKLGGGFEVYLQFDSLKSEALKTIRNQDMRKIRQKALAMLQKYNISTSLVCVIEKGVNDNEIEDLIQFAQEQDCVRGIVFQPVQEAGRVQADGDFRITLSEIRQKVIDANNSFTAADMIPLPCDPHKICVGYAAKTKKDGKVNILPVTGKIPREMITGQKGTIAFEQDKDFVKTVIDTVSLDTALSSSIVLKDKVKQQLFCCWPDFLAPKNMGYENVFRIVIMEFTDAYNFDSTNIKRECNFMIEPNKAIPFSTYNMIYGPKIEAIRKAKNRIQKKS